MTIRTLPRARLSHLTGLLCGLLVVLVVVEASGQEISPYEELDRYRNVRKQGCPKVKLVSYRGKHLKYSKRLRVNTHFKGQLETFESIASTLAEEIYGRAPYKILHMGSYNCRSVRGKPHKMSEHGIGNAIDIKGFRFKALPRKERRGKGRLGRSFTVSVLRHWGKKRNSKGLRAKHREFLQRLVVELHNRGVFRIMLGPGFPGHRDHLHLDFGTWNFACMKLDPARQEEITTGRYWTPAMLKKWRAMRRARGWRR